MTKILSNDDDLWEIKAGGSRVLLVDRSMDLQISSIRLKVIRRHLREAFTTILEITFVVISSIFKICVFCIEDGIRIKPGIYDSLGIYDSKDSIDKIFLIIRQRKEGLASKD